MLRAILLYFYIAFFFFSNAVDITNVFAKNGVFNLTSQPLSWLEKESIFLNGEWEFFWEQFCSSTRSINSNYTSCDSIPKTGYISVPSFWHTYQSSPTKLPGTGFATYRLKLLSEIPPGQVMALNLEVIPTSYELEWNGKIIASSGKIGTNYKETKPSYKTQVVFISNWKKENEVILRISNFHLNEGGFSKAILIGSAPKIISNRDTHIHSDWFVFGTLLIMGIYHLGLYYLRRSESSTLWFAIFCFLFGVRSIIMGNAYLYSLFPDNYWWLLLKIEYLPAYLGMPVFALYFYKVFPFEVSKKSYRVLFLLALYSLLLFFLVLLKYFLKQDFSTKYLSLFVVYTLFV